MLPQIGNRLKVGRIRINEETWDAGDPDPKTFVLCNFIQILGLFVITQTQRQAQGVSGIPGTLSEHGPAFTLLIEDTGHTRVWCIQRGGAQGARLQEIHGL